MDVSHYRDTGEYSDLRIRVDGKDFNLHKFPIFLKCDHLRKKNQDVVEFKNFPGGPFIFSLAADFCYGKCVVFTLANIIGLRCAAELLEMNGDQNLGDLADDYIDDMLESALKAKTMSHILELTSQCVEIGLLAAKVRATDRCFLTILEMYPIPCNPKSGTLITPGYDDHSTIELVIDKLEKMPLEQVVSLIRLCNDKKHLWTALSHLVHDFLYRIFKVHQKRISDEAVQSPHDKKDLKTLDMSKLSTIDSDSTLDSTSSAKKKKKKKGKSSDNSGSTNASDKSKSSKKGSKKGKKGKKKKDKKGGKDGKSSKDKSSKDKSSKDKSSKDKSSTKDKSSKDKSSKDKSSKDKSVSKSAKDKSAKEKPSKSDAASVKSEKSSASGKKSSKTSSKGKKGKGKNKSNSALSEDELNASALDSIDNLNSYFTFKQSSNFSNRRIPRSISLSPSKVSQNNNVADKSGDVITLNECDDNFENSSDMKRQNGDIFENKTLSLKKSESFSKPKTDKMTLFHKLLDRKSIKATDSASDTISDTRSMPIWKHSKDCNSLGSFKTWNTDSSFKKIGQLESFEEENVNEHFISDDKMKCAATSPFFSFSHSKSREPVKKENQENKITSTETFMKKNYELLKSILQNLQKEKHPDEEMIREKTVKCKNSTKTSLKSNEESENKKDFSKQKDKTRKHLSAFKLSSKSSSEMESIKKIKPNTSKSFCEDLFYSDNLKNKMKKTMKPQKTANIFQSKSMHCIIESDKLKSKPKENYSKSSSQIKIEKNVEDSKKVPLSNTKSECMISHVLDLNRKPANSGCNPDYTVLGSSECICSVLEKRQKKLNKLQKSFDTIQNKRQILKDLCQKNTPLKQRIKKQKCDLEQRAGSNNANDSVFQNQFYENSISPTNPSCTASLSTSITLETYAIDSDNELNSDSENECSEIQWQNGLNTNQNNITEHLQHIKKGSCRFVQVPINSTVSGDQRNRNRNNDSADMSNVSNAFQSNNKPNAGAILDAVLTALPDRKLLNHLMSGEWLKMALITAHKYKCESWHMLLDTAGELLFEFNMDELRSLPIDLLIGIIKRALGMNRTNPKAFVLMYSRFMDEVILRGNLSPEEYIKLVEAVPVLLQPHPDRMFIYAEKILSRVLDEGMRKKILATVDMSRCSEDTLRQAVHRSILGVQEFYAARLSGDVAPPNYPHHKREEKFGSLTAPKTSSSVDPHEELGSLGNASGNNLYAWKQNYGEKHAFNEYHHHEQKFNNNIFNRIRMGQSHSDKKGPSLANEKLDDLLRYNVNQRNHMARRYPSVGNESESYNLNYRNRNTSASSVSPNRSYQSKPWNTEGEKDYRRIAEPISYYDNHPPNSKSRFQLNKQRSDEYLQFSKSRRENYPFHMAKPRIEEYHKEVGMNENIYNQRYMPRAKMPLSGRSKSPLSNLTDFSHLSSNINSTRRMPYSYSKYSSQNSMY